MKLLFDLFPVVLFFLAFKLGQVYDVALAGWLSGFGGAAIDPALAPILIATLTAIAASLAQFALVLARGRRPEPMMCVSLAIILIFGGLTLVLRDDRFIKLKPTILYWSFAAALAVAQLRRCNLLRYLLTAQLTLSPERWRGLQLAWLTFFGATGLLNLIVAFTCSTEIWVDFKLFGILGLTLIFTIAVAFWLGKDAVASDNGPRSGAD